MCARFLSYLLLLYIERVHVAISGCTVLGEVHPVSAQNKTLISDTVLQTLCCRFLVFFKSYGQYIHTYISDNSYFKCKAENLHVKQKGKSERVT